MRTKALLCAAALAAGAATTMAQNVYSLNVVGYINLTLQPGLNLIANQLDADGYMTNNTFSNVFGTVLPVGTRIYAFTGGSYAPALTWGASGWVGGAAKAAVNAALTPGSGMFVSLPTTATATTLTLVGQVIQGTNGVALIPGLNMVSSIAPIAGTVMTNLGYVPVSGDRILTYSATAQAYGAAHTWNGTKWIGGDAAVNVGDAFWLNSASTGNTTWTQAFTVQ